MNKLKYLLQGYPYDFIRNFKTDDTGLFSITPSSHAKNLVNTLRKFIPSCARILDATVCVGGDTIAFANYFENIVSNEFDANRFQMLKDNITLYNTKFNQNRNCNISFTNSNILDYFSKYSENKDNYFDLIYFDPPWGGEDYYKQKSLDLYFERGDNKVNVLDFISTLRNYTRFVVMKVPSNYNFKQIKNTRMVFETRVDISVKKGTWYNVYCFEFIKETNGRYLHCGRITACKNMSKILDPATKLWISSFDNVIVRFDNVSKPLHNRLYCFPYNVMNNLTCDFTIVDEKHHTSFPSSLLRIKDWVLIKVK